MNVHQFPRSYSREPIPFYIWLKHHHSPRIQRIAALAHHKDEAMDGGIAFLTLTELSEVYYIFCITQISMPWFDGDELLRRWYDA